MEPSLRVTSDDKSLMKLDTLIDGKIAGCVLMFFFPLIYANITKMSQYKISVFYIRAFIKAEGVYSLD